MKLTLAILFGLAGLTASAQTSTLGPYYPMPSWAQKISCDTQSNCARFAVLSNWDSAVVFDRVTGLVWERTPSTRVFDFFAAADHCNQLKTGSRLGWRLPTIEELGSLMETSSGKQALPAGHPFTTTTSGNIFSTNISADPFFTPNSRWVFNGAPMVVPMAQQGLAWCVRGGSGPDAQ